MTLSKNNLLFRFRWPAAHSHRPVVFILPCCCHFEQSYLFIENNSHDIVASSMAWHGPSGVEKLFNNSVNDVINCETYGKIFLASFLIFA